jgi:hypothetical protein
MEHAQAPQQQSAFMQPTSFDAPPSITPPLATNLVPSVPFLPTASAPPGWNDPPPLTSFAKVKAEPAVIETINHPMGVVEQPAIPIIQPFEGSFNQGSMNAPVDMIQNQHHQQAPEPVQPAQALLPIPNEHLIIHDVTAASVKRNNGVDESMDEEEFSPRLERQKKPIIQKSKQEHTRKFSKLSLSLRKTNTGQECPLCR